MPRGTRQPLRTRSSRPGRARPRPVSRGHWTARRTEWRPAAGCAATRHTPASADRGCRQPPAEPPRWDSRAPPCAAEQRSLHVPSDRHAALSQMSTPGRAFARPPARRSRPPSGSAVRRDSCRLDQDGGATLRGHHTVVLIPVLVSSAGGGEHVAQELRHAFDRETIGQIVGADESDRHLRRPPTPIRRGTRPSRDRCGEGDEA